MGTNPTPDSTGFFPITFARYRKAAGAFVGAFIASFPVVSYVAGTEMSDPKGLLVAAVNAAAAAAFAALFPKNEG